MQVIDPWESLNDGPAVLQGEGWVGSFGGFCPVQGEGRVDGLPWFFRARGSRWQFAVALSPDGDPVETLLGGPGFRLDAPCKDGYAAGWLKNSEAAELIREGIEAYRHDHYKTTTHQKKKGLADEG